MFGAFLEKLAKQTADPLADDDARLALTALLVRVARTDGSYDPAEANRIERIISTRYGLDAADTTELRRRAEALEAEAPDTVRFTRAIKDAVSLEERIGVIEALWDVVMADGIREDEENALLRLVANLLGVNDRDSNMARKRVMDARA